MASNSLTSNLPAVAEAGAGTLLGDLHAAIPMQSPQQLALQAFQAGLQELKLDIDAAHWRSPGAAPRLVFDLGKVRFDIEGEGTSAVPLQGRLELSKAGNIELAFVAKGESQVADRAALGLAAYFIPTNLRSATELDLDSSKAKLSVIVSSADDFKSLELALKSLAAVVRIQDLVLDTYLFGRVQQNLSDVDVREGSKIVPTIPFIALVHADVGVKRLATTLQEQPGENQHRVLQAIIGELEGPRSPLNPSVLKAPNSPYSRMLEAAFSKDQDGQAAVVQEVLEEAAAISRRCCIQVKN
jgi:hypothetical protein